VNEEELQVPAAPDDARQRAGACKPKPRRLNIRDATLSCQESDYYERRRERAQ